MDSLRVLIVESDPGAENQLRAALAAALPDVRIECARDLPSASRLLAKTSIHCALVNEEAFSDPQTPWAELHPQQPGSRPALLILTAETQARPSTNRLSRKELTPRVVDRAVHYAIERQRMEQELGSVRHRLEALTLVDPLTGCLNREGMEAELATLHADGIPCVAILIDLDDFQRVNETWGYASGDLVLREAALTIRGCLRGGDILARVGGDEFLVLLPEASSHDALKIGEKIRLHLGEARIEDASGEIQVTASLGATKVNEQTRSGMELLQKAQWELRESKRAGKNRISWTTVLPETRDEPFPERSKVLQQICRGEGIRVVQQPIVRLADGEVIGHELLTRGPVGPYDMPIDFFRIAQEERVLNAVDLRCLEACVAASAKIPADRHIHVNLLPSTILDTGPARIQEAMGGLDGRKVFLELGERQLFGDPTYLLDSIETLRESGINLAVDDVGFGRSCLESLIVLRPHLVKIDRGWVTGAYLDAYRTNWLQRLKLITDALNIPLVAEGIETDQDLDFVRKLGFEYGQGYLWGKPAPIE
ncbi:MAG: EAL domain-containing protein [Planctomycetes bacterium]|nr:EAL domain-containing protein [Planctomycetota bacterium]